MTRLPKPASAALPHGPFDTERQARGLPAVRAVYEAFDADPGAGKMAPHNHRLLAGAIAAAGVELGDYDRRIVAWLAGWEPQTCAVLAGLVIRAHAAGQASARADTDDWRNGYEAGCDDEAASFVPDALDVADLPTVLNALDVAAEYRRYRASLTCGDCADHPAELCESHAADLERADEYDAVAARTEEATR